MVGTMGRAIPMPIFRPNYKEKMGRRLCPVELCLAGIFGGGEGGANYSSAPELEKRV